MYTIQNDYMDLEQIAQSGQCFRWEKLDDNAYKIPMLDTSVEVKQNKNEFTFYCDEDEFNKIWRHYLDLDTDYAKIIEKIADDDKFLKDAASYGRGIRILNQNLWEIMVSFVISQNNNIPRITKSLNMLCEKFSQFPQSAALFSLKKEELAGLGLGYRDEYIINLAGYYNESEDVSGKLFSLGYEDAMKELMSIKGIGRKVANCICLFGLHRLEACPIDTWMKKIIDEDYNGTMPLWMKDKWAGVYQQYVFYYKRMNK